MRKAAVHKWALWILLVAWVFIVRCLGGCSADTADEGKVRDLEFTVVGDGEIPEELRNTIEQKKTSPFKLTYSDDQGLYIVTGYGEQESGGYSIVVEELYLTENAIYVKTCLMGPGADVPDDGVKSYPYIVIKTEYLDYAVVFN